VARQAAPCVLFLDELDAIASNRGFQTGSSSAASQSETRVLATLLTEMDGISSPACTNESTGGAAVIVLAASNRLDCIDAALLRKGRFHQSIFVGKPDGKTRHKLVLYFGHRCGLQDEATDEAEGDQGTGVLGRLATRLGGAHGEGMSGAEVEAVVRERAMDLLRTRVQQEQEQWQ